jgi:sulfur-oxidizing protein SoxY
VKGLPVDGDAEPAELDLARRRLLTGLAVLTVTPLVPATSSAQAWNDIDTRIRRLVGVSPITPGRVTLEMPALAENGNLVSLTVSVESPMTDSDHVSAIHIFTERNPLSTIAAFHLGPRAGRARVQTNIRLAATQTVTAIARMNDGRFWVGTAKVDVTVAACVDGG